MLADDDPCDPNLCQHQGVCVPSADDFTCVCPVPYTGHDCSQGNPHTVLRSSSSRSSGGNSSLLNEGGSASQVPQASVQLAGYGSVVWPDSLSEWLVDGTGLQ